MVRTWKKNTDKTLLGYYFRWLHRRVVNVSLCPVYQAGLHDNMLPGPLCGELEEGLDFLRYTDADDVYNKATWRSLLVLHAGFTGTVILKIQNYYTNSYFLMCNTFIKVKPNSTVPHIVTISSPTLKLSNERSIISITYHLLTWLESNQRQQAVLLDHTHDPSRKKKKPK